GLKGGRRMLTLDTVSTQPVRDDSNCGYRVIALDSRNDKNDFEAIKVDMINELRLHMDDYLKLYEGEERLAYIREALLPPKRKSRHGVALMEKCPPADPSSQIFCLGYIPSHYVYVKLKDGCPIPPTCGQWKKHCKAEAVAWESNFLDRQTKFDELMKEERGDNKMNIKFGSKFDPIEL
ncbi:phosphomannose isomerase, partial [Trifolium pratense]